MPRETGLTAAARQMLLIFILALVAALGALWLLRARTAGPVEPPAGESDTPTRRRYRPRPPRTILLDDAFTVARACRAAAPRPPEILFTGFTDAERAELEAVAVEAGFIRRGSVTRRLTLLCVGENAGPRKLADAREKGIPVISREGLLRLIREGYDAD